MDKLIQENFWRDILIKLQNWTITELPGIVITVVLLLILFRVVRFSLFKLKKSLIFRAVEKGDVDGTESEKRITTLIGIVHSVVKIVLWVVFVMILLKKFSIDIGPILASAGILGLAIGFGAQELVRDFISGFFILLENQIRLGDVAIINGTGGLVEKIELRTITLRDFSGVIHIFQNGKISSLSNMTKGWSATVFDIGVAYKEDVQKVMDVMKKVGDEMQNDENFAANFLEPIEIFGLDQFGDSALVIKARIKTKPIQQWVVGREYRKRLKVAFDKEGIEIPFPHRTVYWGEKIASLKLDINSDKKASD